METGKVLAFCWMLGVAYTWGRVMVYMQAHGRNPLSIEGGMSAAAYFFVWPIILGYVNGDREE